MTFRRTPLALAMAAIAGGLASLPAMAGVVVMSESFSNAASVTDGEASGSTSNDGASLGSTNLQQFNPAVGVLTGTKVSLDSNRTQTVTVTAVGQSSSSNSKTTSGSGSSSARLALPGLDQTFSPAITGSASCSGQMQSGCTNTASPSPSATSLSAQPVPAAKLNSYVGSGSVTATRTAPALSATQANGEFPGAETTKYSVTWAGTLTVEYTYLDHAAPSFDGAQQLTFDLDFGTVTQGSAASPLAFDIFNALGGRVGLDLDEIVGSGDTSRLSTNLALFDALGAGSSHAYLASFDTSAIGDFSASYALTLSDADVGASASRFDDFGLTLNLKGTVVARTAPQPPTQDVPEPGALALVGIGLLGLRLGRRRRPDR